MRLLILNSFAARTRFFCCLLLLCVARFEAAAQESHASNPDLKNAGGPLEKPWIGDWFGGFEGTKAAVIIVVHFSAAKDEMAGTIDMIDLGEYPYPQPRMGKPLTHLEANASQIHFEAENGLSFEERLTDGVMTGYASQSGKKFPFEMVRIAEVTKANIARYPGRYEMEAGHFVAIYPSGLSANLLFSLDSSTGQLEHLIPGSETTFNSGHDTVRPSRADGILRFTTNEPGNATGIEWKPKHGAIQAGKPIELPEEEVSFTNGGVKLAGTLILPPTKGPHPAVVFLHGSGPQSGKQMRTFADFFALNGVAALIYDKRGVGASTGDWKKSSFADLAGDGLAGVEMLKQRREIKSRQIGLWGASQGGWLAGLAASLSTNVAFIISVSGPGVTPEEQGAFMVEHRMRTAGFSEKDIKEALSLYEWNSRCARSGEGWDEHEAAVKAAKSKPWYGSDTNPYNRHDQEFWRLIWEYDPAPVLQKVHCPVLAIYGELDALVPVKKSAAIWKANLARAGNKDVTIKIFPRADHGITDLRAAMQAPEYFTLQRDWLLKRTQPGR